MKKHAILIKLGVAIAAGLAAGLLMAAAAPYSTPQIREYPTVTEYVDAMVLGVASTAEDWTVPAGCNFAVFSATANFYVAFGTEAAAIPAADVTDGSAPMLNPSARRVTPADVLSIVSPTAGAIVTIECYADGGFDVQ